MVEMLDDVERQVIGGIIKDPDAYSNVEPILGASSAFVSPKHRKIFSAAKQLHDRSEPIDVTTITHELERTSGLERVGGRAELVQIVEDVVCTANIAQHAHIVAEEARRRNLKVVAGELQRSAEDPARDVDEIISRAQSKLDDLAVAGASHVFSPLADYLPAAWENIEREARGEPSPTAIATGFSSIDSIFSGFNGGELIVVGGRTSNGKTQFALQVALNAALHCDKLICYADYEMSAVALAQRANWSVSRQSKTGLLGLADKNKALGELGTAYDRLKGCPNFRVSDKGLTATELRAQVRRARHGGSMDLLVVDYLQRVPSGGKYASREQEVTAISHTLKTIAMENRIPVIALSQLSRQADDKDEPRLGHLRESGAIEQDADVVMLVQLDSDLESVVREGKIRVAKNRNGATFAQKMKFIEGRWEDATGRTEPKRRGK